MLFCPHPDLLRSKMSLTNPSGQESIPTCRRDIWDLKMQLRLLIGLKRSLNSLNSQHSGHTQPSYYFFSAESDGCLLNR